MRRRDGAPSASPGSGPAGGRSHQVIELPRFEDERGGLTTLELEALGLFRPARAYWIQDVPPGASRGRAAHRRDQRLMVCLRGSVRVLLDDGREAHEVLLDRPDRALHVRPLTWIDATDFSPDALLLVFSDHPHDPDEPIRDRDEFLALVGA